MLKLLSRLRGNILFRADIYLAFDTTSRLELSGFLISEFSSINALIAMCPLSEGLGSSDSPQEDLLRQMRIAIRIARDPAAGSPFHDAINLRAHSNPFRVFPKWVYALACIPLTKSWSGELLHPQPFCPELFKAMAQQPQAIQWLNDQNKTR